MLSLRDGVEDNNSKRKALPTGAKVETAVKIRVQMRCSHLLCLGTAYIHDSSLQCTNYHLGSPIS